MQCLRSIVDDKNGEIISNSPRSRTFGELVRDERIRGWFFDPHRRCDELFTTRRESKGI